LTNPIMRSPIGLSAVVITLNSAATLKRCLESLSFADEVIVLDGGSTDQTKVIACECGAKFSENSDWQGFGVQKNRALDLASHEWILLLDSDEWLEVDAAQEIRQLLEEAGKPTDHSDDKEGRKATPGSVAPPTTGPLAYRLRRRSRYLGRIVRHSGWWPDHVTRLFHRDAARYSEDWVHERLLLREPKRLGTLCAVIEHDAVMSVEQVLSKTNRYSTLSAKQMHAAGRSASVRLAIGKGLWAFVRTYLFQLGFLDGRVGFLIAFHSAETTFYRYLKLWEVIESKGVAPP
jgi:glycosyltransferase involved in cell wall biosynthesis